MTETFFLCATAKDIMSLLIHETKIRYYLQDLKGNISLDTYAFKNETVLLVRDKLLDIHCENLAQGLQKHCRDSNQGHGGKASPTLLAVLL